MKKKYIRAALLRGVVCLAALALALTGAVFAVDHGSHSGWMEMPQEGGILEEPAYYMNINKAINNSVYFQGDGNQLFCLAGRTLTMSLSGYQVFDVFESLTIENCASGGELHITGGPVNVYKTLSLTENVRITGDIDVKKNDNSQTGSLTVGAGSTVIGSITVEDGAAATIQGETGKINVQSGGQADIYGTVNGKITVEEGGTLNIHEGAVVKGGVQTGGTCTITGGTIQDAYNESNVHVTGGTCTISGGTIQKNKNDNESVNGGGVYVAGGECIINGAMNAAAKITGNTAQNGGGVYVASGGKCIIDGNAEVNGNTAQNGGGVYVASGGTCWLRENSVILNNSANTNGGGVYVEQGSSFVVYSTVTENTAGRDGGGIYLAGPAAGEAGNYSMDDASITFNTAQNGGGVYAGKDVRITMTSGSFRSNTAELNGAGVYMEEGSELATYAQFTENKATGNGGGIWAENNCTIYLNGSDSFRGLLSNNTAAYGSGMYISGAKWNIEFMGALIDDGLYLAGDTNAVDNVVRIKKDDTVIRGEIKTNSVSVYLDSGTISSTSVELTNSSCIINDGYCNISGFNTDGNKKITLYGGYFNTEPTDTSNINVGNTENPRKMLKISGNAGDANYDPAYREEYPYGVYTVKNDAASLDQGTITYDGQPVEPGVDFTIHPNGTTLLEYSCRDEAGSPVSGWPTNAGVYTIQAKCLNVAEKWYAETSFSLTIGKATPSYTAPTGLTARVGKPLSDVALPQGWAWKNSDTVPEQEGEAKFAAIYTPADTANYNTVELELTVQVEHNHVGVLQPEQPATCTEPGVKSYYQCSVSGCGARFEDAACNTPISDFENWKVIPPLGHDYGWNSHGDGTHTGVCRRQGCGASTTPEACTGGEATYFLQAKCQVCGGSYGPLKADVTPPTGEIVLGENHWNQFLNDITFGLFFNKTQQVTVAATDDSYAVGGYTPDKAARVEYYLHSGGTALTQEELKGVRFTEYKGPFSVEPQARLVVYVKIADHAGNTVYIGSNGIVMDGAAPTLTGVENGAVYYVTQAVKVSDENLSAVTLNGVAVGTEFTLAGDTSATYAVTAADKAGSVTAVTVTMKPLSTLEKEMEGLTVENVTAEARPRLEALEATLKGIDLADATQAEKDKVESLLARCRELLARLGQTEWTPSPTATPAPTATPPATPTPKPAATAKPAPASTATPKPTAVPEPSASAAPTPSPTPLPTESPAPTQGQEPSDGFPWGLALLGLALAALIGVAVVLVLRRRSDDEQY